MGIATFGSTNVDWEARIDMDRLRRERLARLKSHLAASEFGALLAFDFSNIRYMTSTHIGTWGIDKMVRFALLVRGAEPIIWDFGSAARHHQLYNPWLSDEILDEATGVRSAVPGTSRSRAGISTLRGAIHPDAGRAESVAAKVAEELRKHGMQNEPLGVDFIELPVHRALLAEGLDVQDGQQVFLEARRVKTRDEISLLTHACGLADMAYEELYSALRPGMRENETVGLVSKVLYDNGSEFVAGINAISGERCNPHPHFYSDRMMRPGDPAYFDIVHTYLGYQTCYYRTFAVGSASPAMRDAYTRCEGNHGRLAGHGEARRHDRGHRLGCGRRRRSSASRTRRQRSRCSTGTVSGYRSGRSRSSPGLPHWTIRRSSRRATSSHWRPTGPPATAGPRPASRKSWWSPPTAAR